MNARSLVFLGSKDAGLRAVRLLAVRLPSGTLKAIICPDDRSDQRSVLGDFESLASSYGVPIHIAHNSEETTALIRACRPSVAIVHGWYKIIPILNLPETRFYGFHYSPLPKYRGNAPLVWQLINGEERLAVSFFVLSPGTDEGELLDQRFFHVSNDEDVSDALNTANMLVEQMLEAFIARWLTDSIVLSKQPDEDPSYCGIRIPDDGRIDWKQPSSIVHNFIRAQSWPYPGAFTLLPDGKKLTIWKSQQEKRRFFGSPGSVVEIGESYVVVACGTGAIRILRMQVDGSNEQTPRTILRSLKTRLI